MENLCFLNLGENKHCEYFLPSANVSIVRKLFRTTSSGSTSYSSLSSRSLFFSISTRRSMTNSPRPSLTLEGWEGLFIPSVDIVPRTGHDSLRRRELRLARVSMCIVILYMVCHAPKLLPTLLELLQGDPKVQFKTLF